MSYVCRRHTNMYLYIYIILCFLCHRSSRVMKPKLMNYKKFRDKNSRDAFIQNNLQILNIIKVCSYFDKKIIMSDWQWQLRDLIQLMCRHRNVIYNCKENTSRDLVLSVSHLSWFSGFSCRFMIGWLFHHI